MFLAEDEKTMIRKPNLRYFARDNGVEHYVYEKAWVINYDQLEVVIAEYMETHVYIPAEIRSKRAKERSADTKNKPFCSIGRFLPINGDRPAITQVDRGDQNSVFSFAMHSVQMRLSLK